MRPMSSLHRLLVPLFTLVLPASAVMVSMVSGCADDPGGAPGGSCVAERFDAQPRSRLVVGQTFYLPVVADREECRSVSWQLTSAPPGNANMVVAGADGIPRFTPHTPGSYTFSLGDGGATETVTAIAGDGLPFHNLNYYPGSSIADVNGEVWTATIYAPTLTRLDAITLKEIGRVDVGPWPVAIAWKPGMKHAVVAQRGGDTLGLVDVASARLEDAIWVGDEPSNVVVAPDGKTAYVTLATERAVVIVDLEKRAVRARVETGWDPVAMALTRDGATLYVASHRSGHPSRYPFGEDPLEEEKDIAVIDTASAQVKAHFLDVGVTINGLLLADDDARLYVATTRSDPSVSLTDTTQTSFAHLVLALDAATGKELASADLTRQPSSGGFAVSTHGMTLDESGVLWVAAEGSDLAVALDAASLAEVGRVAAPGRPRGVTRAAGAVLVHGAQGFKVTRIAGLGGEAATAPSGTDPRPELVARGQAHFTGAGETYGQNWTCNSCHADGGTDTLIWKAGPFNFRAVTRPQFWLEGAERLGWSGYVDNVRDFAWTVGNTIGVRPRTDEAEGLHAFLASLMPPPAANGATRRDGSLSEAGLRGKALYEGKGACTACHALPLGTNREVLENGITEGETDVPSLVGAYRHGVWMKHGEARDLRSAVVMVLEALGNASLSGAEVDDLTRYVAELTARDFFVLASSPGEGGGAAAVDAPIQLTFSHPVHAEPSNLAHIRLLDASGEAVPAAVEVDGRHVTITPSAPLAASSEYAIDVAAPLESLEERRIFAATRIPFTTAAPPSLRLEGEYTWTTQMPLPNKDTQSFDMDKTVPVPVQFSALPSSGGLVLRFDLGQDLLFDAGIVIDGAALRTPALPIPVGQNLADSSGLQADLIDDDADGIADRAAGQLTLSGPGFEVPGIAWELARKAPPGACEEGLSGSLPVEVSAGDKGQAVIAWGADAALALYVTSPGAQLPAGPGQTVMNGDTYWSLDRASPPAGFAGPVTYLVVPEGAVDSTAKNGGKEGGVPLEPGGCYTFSIITTSFSVGQRTVRW